MEKYKTFKDFYPYYLSEHSNKYTKLLHFIGTSIGILFLINFFLSFDFIFLLFAVFTYLNPSLANTVTQTKSNELLKTISISGWNNFANALKDNEDDKTYK